MKKLLSFTKLTFMAMIAIAIGAVMYACQDDPAADLATPSNALSKPTLPLGTGTTECDVTYITTQTLSSANNYELFGDVRVASGQILTIQPGTVIFGNKASRGTLSIEMGGKIMAAGTELQPIVFTSSAAPGDRRPNDWGGINIFGQAPNNLGTNLSPEGYPACVTAPLHGGTICADNSGVLSYVRIEYGGIPVSDPNILNSEKNALTLYSVGSGTQIDHIQVSYGGDDGFEFFGGTVSASYLFSLGMVDDDFDTDNGYGADMNDITEGGECPGACVQYAVSVRHPYICDISASNGFESDNNAQGLPTLPRTGALFSNVTLLGPYDSQGSRSIIPLPPPALNKRFGDGIHLRRSSGLDVENTLVLGWHLRQFFADNTVVDADVLSTTIGKPFGVVTASNYAEPANPNNYFSRNLSLEECSNVVLDITANGDEGTTGSMAELSGLTGAAWPALLQIDSNPSTEYWEFDTFFADDLRPVSGANITMDGCLRDCADPNTTTDEATTYFRGAFREQFTDDGWDTDGNWLQMNPQFVPYP